MIHRTVFFTHTFPPSFLRRAPTTKQSPPGIALEGISHCAVCLHDFSEPVTLVECFHSFCFACISTWFKRSSNCPLCKCRSASFVKVSEKQLQVWSHPKSKTKNKDQSDVHHQLAIEVHTNRFLGMQDPGDRNRGKKRKHHTEEWQCGGTTINLNHQCDEAVEFVNK